MRFILENKIYDTDKAEVICEFRAIKPLMFCKTLTSSEDAILYKTNKGNWFSVIERLEECTPLKKAQVKELLKNLNNVELYEKYFGKLKEA